MSLRLMKERIKQSGTTLYDEQIKDAQDILAYGFQDDVSYSRHIYFWIGGAEPQKGEHIDMKLYDRKYSSANGRTQKFLTKHTDKVDIGDYIYDEKEGTYWLCTESYNINDVHYEGKLTECNWYLRWQRADGVIVEYPAQDLNSTQYNSGESGNATITLGSAQHMETVQANEDTLALASPQRFYVSRNHTIPFVVTQNDSTALNYGTKGICRITVTQDVIRDVDRPDLGICDYREVDTNTPSEDPTTPPENPDEMTDLRAVISGNKNLKVGFSRTYTATITDVDGNAIEWDDTYSWNVISDFDVGQEVTNNKIKLLVDDEDLIDSIFKLQVTKDDVVISEIEITIIAFI